MTDPGDLSPTGTTPSAPAPAAAPASAPLHTPAPAVRRPQPVNPRSQRPTPHWSDASSAESQYARNYAKLSGDERGATAPIGEPPTATPPAAPSDPAAGEKHKFGDLELTEAEIQGLRERAALEESRRATLPPTAKDYRLELPSDFHVPAGLEVRLNAADPLLASAQEFAHRHGLTQSAFSQMVGVWASAQVAQTQKLQGLMDAEKQRLGPNGPARVTSIGNFLKAVAGEELAADLVRGLVTARQVLAYERIMERVVGQGSADFSSAHREPPASNGEIPGYDQMDFIQRRAAQDAIRARRGR